jgi:hypothetical protein
VQPAGSSQSGVPSSERRSQASLAAFEARANCAKSIHDRSGPLRTGLRSRGGRSGMAEDQARQHRKNSDMAKITSNPGDCWLGAARSRAAVGGVCRPRSGVSALALGELAAVPAAGAPKREDPCWGAARRGTLVSAERDGSTFGEVAHRGPTWRNPSGLLRGGQLTAGGGSDRPARQLLLGGVMA